MLCPCLFFCTIKGDNFVGLNFGTTKSTIHYLNQNTETTVNSAGISYSTFIKENRRLNFTLSYSHTKSPGQLNKENTSNGYGFGVGYGILFPLLKNFYAEITPGANYSFRKYPQETTNYEDYNYSLNLTGGLLWVPFKHFGVSANLIGLSFGYAKSKSVETSNNQTYETKTSSLSFTNQGSLQNQSFSIFFKF
nr:hypothetical protein [uncultured Pedobacter sp.]